MRTEKLDQQNTEGTKSERGAIFLFFYSLRKHKRAKYSFIAKDIIKRTIVVFSQKLTL